MSEAQLQGTELSDEAKKLILNKDAARGSRVSGKNWKEPKNAFRIKSLGVGKSWKKKQEQRLKEDQVRAKLRELKEEKEAEKKSRIDKIKERREKKEEKERYERMAAVMHAKKVDRLKRREKRNKLLKER